MPEAKFLKHDPSGKPIEHDPANDEPRFRKVDVGVGGVDLGGSGGKVEGAAPGTSAADGVILSQLDQAVDDIEVAHRTRRHLIHLADESLGDGFGAQLEVVSTPAGSPFPVQYICYTDGAAHVDKLWKIDIVLNANKTIDTALYTLYDTDGATPLSPKLLVTMDYTDFLTPKLIYTFPA